MSESEDSDNFDYLEKLASKVTKNNNKQNIPEISKVPKTI